MARRNLFEMLDGLPAQVLVFAGLALVLLAPLIPQFRLAAVRQAQSAYENSEALIELEMEEIRKEQEKASKENSVALSTMTFDERQAETQKQQARMAELERVADEKREELKKQYDRTRLKRELLMAQRDASGMRWHMGVGWLGRLALLMGLLTLTVRSDGTTQKIYLVILLVVLFSALSGVQIDLLAAGHMGGSDDTSVIDALRSGR